MNNKEQNMCDGCQRGLAYVEDGNHYDKRGKIVMGCTKDRYEKPEGEKCYSCGGKGTYSQIHGVHGAEDFGGDGFDEKPSIHNYPCKPCNGTGIKPVSPQIENKEFRGIPIVVDETKKEGEWELKNIPASPVQREGWEESFDILWEGGKVFRGEEELIAYDWKTDIKHRIRSLLAAQREEMARQVEKELTPGDGQYDNGYEDAINKSLSIIRTPLSDTK